MTVQITLADAVAKQIAEVKQDIPSDQFIDRVVKLCEAIAELVLDGVKNDFDTCLLAEVMDLADKTKQPAARCAVLLQHSVSNGRKYGITVTALEELGIVPPSVTNLVATLVRKEGESYGAHYHRLIEDHTAVRLMLTELVGRADITKYATPTKQNHIRCCGLLDRAMVLKNYPCYKDNAIGEIADDITDISTLEMLEVRVKEVTPHVHEIEYFFHGGFISVGKAVISWTDGKATVALRWDRDLGKYYKNQDLVADITEEEFINYVGIHHWFYETNLN